MVNNYSIIVSIDLMNGKCVRLTQGNFLKKKVYNNDPLEVAIMLEDNGISRIHIVDLDGAKKGKVIHWKILEKIAKKTNLIIDFGGGIHEDKDIISVFNSGANIASIGSIVINNPILLNNWINNYGNDKILVGLDLYNNKIAINGWTKFSNISILDFFKNDIYSKIKNIFCTDIYKDGSLLGPSFYLYKKIIKKFPKINLIASGGVSNIKDVKKLLKLGCYGVIIGKAFYEKKISFSDIKNILYN